MRATISLVTETENRRICTMRIAVYCAKLSVGLAVVLAETMSPLMAATCQGLLRQGGLPQRELILLSNGAVLGRPSANILRRRGSEFAYIVPSHQFTSGAVVIKTRHLVNSQSPSTSTNPRIKLYRDSYQSPCVQKKQADVGSFENEAEVRRYRYYHRNRLPDPYPLAERLDRWHADIGNRPASWFIERDDRCASTADWNIRSQFLFEDNLVDRLPIGFFDYFSERVEATVDATRTNRAYGAPPAYSKYEKLAVQIKPYRKTAGGPSCISFSIPEVPRGAVATDIMIFDADDARMALPFVDPQSVWRVQWD
jgi:hypothetical protein